MVCPSFPYLMCPDWTHAPEEVLAGLGIPGRAHKEVPVSAPNSALPSAAASWGWSSGGRIVHPTSSSCHGHALT